MGCEDKKYINGKINCDQIVWLLAMADRYLPKKHTIAIDRQRDMQKYAMLYEIIDILGLEFADKSAMYNATPLDIRED